MGRLQTVIRRREHYRPDERDKQRRNERRKKNYTPDELGVIICCTGPTAGRSPCKSGCFKTHFQVLLLKLAFV